MMVAGGHHTPSPTDSAGRQESSPEDTSPLPLFRHEDPPANSISELVEQLLRSPIAHGSGASAAASTTLSMLGFDLQPQPQPQPQPTRPGSRADMGPVSMSDGISAIFQSAAPALTGADMAPSLQPYIGALATPSSASAGMSTSHVERASCLGGVPAPALHGLVDVSPHVTSYPHQPNIAALAFLGAAQQQPGYSMLSTGAGRPSPLGVHADLPMARLQFSHCTTPQSTGAIPDYPLAGHALPLPPPPPHHQASYSSWGESTHALPGTTSLGRPEHCMHGGLASAAIHRRTTAFSPPSTPPVIRYTQPFVAGQHAPAATFPCMYPEAALSFAGRPQAAPVSRNRSLSNAGTSTGSLLSGTSENHSDNDESESSQGSEEHTDARARANRPAYWKNRPRNSISRTQKRLFYSWLLEHTRFPFPTENERAGVLAHDPISERQFKYWFANIRCRQFTKHRDPDGNLYFVPSAKFYESCIRLGLPIGHEIPSDVRQGMRILHRSSSRKD